MFIVCIIIILSLSSMHAPIHIHKTHTHIVPSGPPLNIAAENRSSTSLRVTWDPPLAAERNGIIISYTVSYASTASTEMNETTSNTEIILESLNIFELYNVTVSANTINGSGPLAYTVERTNSDSKFSYWIKNM